MDYTVVVEYDNVVERGERLDQEMLYIGLITLRFAVLKIYHSSLDIFHTTQ